MKKKLRALVVLGVLFVSALVMSGCGKKDVDLKNCVQIDVSGADGYGELSVSIEQTNLRKLVVDEEDINSLSKEAIEFAAKYAAASGKLSCSADKTSELKNGDNVTIKVENFETMEDEFDLAFSNTEFTYTVSGLKEVQEVDPWDGVTVSFDGDVSSGYSAQVNAGNQPYSQYIRYDIEGDAEITEGGTVTVKYSCEDEDMVAGGYAVKKDAPETKEFPVTGLDSYIQAYSDITADAQEQMKAKGVSLIKSSYFGENGSYSDIRDKLSERKNLDYGWEDAKGKLKSAVNFEQAYFKTNDNGNSVRLMFSFKVKDRKTSAIMHAVVQYNNVVKKSSGDTYVNYEKDYDENYSIIYLDTSVKDIENELVTNNEFEKVQ